MSIHPIAGLFGCEGRGSLPELPTGVQMASNVTNAAASVLSVGRTFNRDPFGRRPYWRVFNNIAHRMIQETLELDHQERIQRISATLHRGEGTRRIVRRQCALRDPRRLLNAIALVLQSIPVEVVPSTSVLRERHLSRLFRDYVFRIKAETPELDQEERVNGITNAIDRQNSFLVLKKEQKEIVTELLALQSDLSLEDRLTALVTEISIQSPRLNAEESRAFKLIALFNLLLQSAGQRGLFEDEFLRGEAPSIFVIREVFDHVIAHSQESRHVWDVLSLFQRAYNNLFKRDAYFLMTKFAESSFLWNDLLAYSVMDVLLPSFHSLSDDELESLAKAAEKDKKSGTFASNLRGIITDRKKSFQIEGAVSFVDQDHSYDTIANPFLMSCRVLPNKTDVPSFIQPDQINIFSKLAKKLVRQTTGLMTVDRIRSVMSETVARIGLNREKRVELLLLASLYEEDLLLFRILASEKYDFTIPLQKILERAIGLDRIEIVLTTFIAYNINLILADFYPIMCMLLESPLNLCNICLRTADSCLNVYSTFHYLLAHYESLSSEEEKERLIVLAEKRGFKIRPEELDVEETE